MSKIAVEVGIGVRRLAVSFIILHGGAVLANSELPPSSSSVDPLQATEGSLWLRDNPSAHHQPAPLLHTDVQMNVSGLIARVRVVQRFQNPARQWVEGVYVFPLPDSAAVDHLRLRAGERVIEGQIQERRAARKAYRKARTQGKRASLVEQERPNIFTTSIANLGPREELVVELEYQQSVRFVDGRFRLRFPMVVGPRYIPGAAVSQSAPQGSGWAPDTVAVPDASRITPPVQHPADGPLNPVALTIELDAGLPLSRIESPYHRIESESLGVGRYRVRLSEETVAADRDFELAWTAQPATVPTTSWFVERTNGEHYALLMLMPPQDLGGVEKPFPRELVFVIDTSGSMHGRSLLQAKRAVLRALEQLSSHDRFNVIHFNDRPHRLFRVTQPASVGNVELARDYIQELDAEGGTRMLPALQWALSERADSAYLKQVVFLTDGSVGNEQQLFELIRNRLGSSRLFTVGIGSAPNSFFMHKAAQYGRGTFTYIGHARETQEKMDALLRKLAHPAVTDITLQTPPGTAIEVYPRKIPDAYLGEPLTLSLRTTKFPPMIGLHGRFAGQPWQAEILHDADEEREGVAIEWARRKIDALMTQYRDASGDDERKLTRAQVVEVALTHHLVSRFTSLVAVDVTPLRGNQEQLQRHALATNLPHGWSYRHVFGLPATSTAGALQILVGLLLLLGSALGVYHLQWRRP